MYMLILNQCTLASKRKFTFSYLEGRINFRCQINHFRFYVKCIEKENNSYLYLIQKTGFVQKCNKNQEYYFNLIY